MPRIIKTNLNREKGDKMTKENFQLNTALVELSRNKSKILNEKGYYDEEQDQKIIKEYYQSIDFNQSDKTAITQSLHQLISNTHENQLPYNSETRNLLYSRVDLHTDGTLKSIYSGNKQDPEQTIREDHEAEQNREKALAKLTMSIFENDQARQKAVADIEREFMYNCEHVVPQSWFDKDNPMRGDLHHLFTCEQVCNSSRSNYPYYDFEDYTPQMEIEAIRPECGKYEDSKFEPESGKGEVARATLYFLLRYPGEINRYNSKDIKMLIHWHHEHEVSIYEKHRNKEIHQIQKNRNPLIDFPQHIDKIDFMTLIKAQ